VELAKLGQSLLANNKKYNILKTCFARGFRSRFLCSFGDRQAAEPQQKPLPRLSSVLQVTDKNVLFVFLILASYQEST
jgi:hypothetical protein